MPAPVPRPIPHVNQLQSPPPFGPPSRAAVGSAIFRRIDTTEEFHITS